MTVPSTPRRAGPFPGDDVTTTLPFSFKAFDETDVRVDRTDTNGVTTTLVINSDYTITLNADQDADPGGEVELDVPLALDELAVVLGGTPNTQDADLPSGGRFNDEVIEQALDRIVFQVQQLVEEVSRAAKVPTTTEDAEDLNEAIAVLTENIDTLNVVVDNIAALVTLADDIADINALAAITDEIEAVAAIATPVVIVASIDTEIAALYAIVADIATVAGDSADIQLLADNIATIAAKANAGANSDITSLTGLTTPLSVAQGGTGVIDGSRLRGPGDVFLHAANTAPAGALKANGAAISRTTYANLFARIGTTHGVGDGSTTFNLPDLRGEFIRGWDDARGVDAGRAFGSAQADAMQGHRHPFSSVTVGSFGGGSGSINPVISAQNTGDPSTDTVNGTPRTAAETRPRNVALLFCIQY